MEIEELKTIWQQYDSKLDNLEKLNKKLILETLSKKPQKKLNWMKYQSLFNLIVSPVLIILSLHNNFRIENIDSKFIIGCILTLPIIVYLCYVEFKSFMTLKDVDVSNDSIIESARKVSAFKSIVANRLKFTLLTFPILCFGLTLIIWKSFISNSHTIIYMLSLIVVIVVLTIKQFKSRKEKIDQLHKEILDLNEYAN